MTGANKGIGFEVCRQQASKGVNVVLTSRDESRGLEALRKLKDESSPAGEVVFHRLDVADPSSIVSFVDFMRARFGKLDILVCNHLNRLRLHKRKNSLVALNVIIFFGSIPLASSSRVGSLGQVNLSYNDEFASFTIFESEDLT